MNLILLLAILFLEESVKSDANTRGLILSYLVSGSDFWGNTNEETHQQANINLFWIHQHYSCVYINIKILVISMIFYLHLFYHTNPVHLCSLSTDVIFHRTTSVTSQV